MKSNKPSDIVVVGAGGHAKVVIELLRDNDFNVIGCTDRDTTSRKILGVPVIGNDDILLQVLREGIKSAFVALGENKLRSTLGQKLWNYGFMMPSIISRNSVISSSSKIGQGVAIMAGAIINADSEVGDFAIINTNASVDHDCIIGDGSHIAPGATLAGGVRIGSRVLVGIGASVLPDLEIGDDAILGGGSVAIAAIPSNVTAVGHPAKFRSDQANG